MTDLDMNKEVKNLSSRIDRAIGLGRRFTLLGMDYQHAYAGKEIETKCNYLCEAMYSGVFRFTPVENGGDNKERPIYIANRDDFPAFIYESHIKGKLTAEEVRRAADEMWAQTALSTTLDRDDDEEYAWSPR